MNELMAPDAVAAEYGVPVHQLARWRRQQRGPAYYALTRRTIRYDPDSVRHWFQNPAQHPAPQPSRPSPPPETTRNHP